MLLVSNVKKLYDGVEILKGISFECEKGQVVSILGNNGSGKTTLLKILAGLIVEDTGEISFNGTSKKDFSKYIRNIGSAIYLDAGYDNYSSYEIVREMALLHGVFDEKDIKNALKIMNIDTDKKIKTYSLGMKTRLNILLAMIGDSSLIILDEPFNGLDPKGIVYLRKVIIRLAKKYNKLVLLSCHSINDVVQMSDKVIVISEGKLECIIDKNDINIRKLESILFKG